MATVLWSNSAENSAATDGTAVTATNSGQNGAGNPFSAVSAGSGNTTAFETDWHFVSGTKCYLFTQSGSAQNNAFVTWSGAQGDFAIGCGVKWSAATPGTTTTIFRGFSDAGYATKVFDVLLTSTGKIQVNTTSGVSSTASISADTDYWLEVRFDSGSTTLTANLYPKGSTTPAATATMSVTAATINSLRMGLSTASANISMRLDDITFGYGGWMDRPDVSITAPTASAGSPQYLASGSTITLSASGSAAGSGSITSYLWTCLEYPAGASSPTITNAATATATAPVVAGRYKFQLVVTQTGGLNDTATVDEYIYAATNTDVSVYSDLTNTYTNVGGAASKVAALSDGSDTTLVQSPDNPAGTVLPLVMCPFGPGPITLYVKQKWATAAVSPVANVYKEDGITLLVSQALTTTSTATEDSIVVPIGTIPNLVDRRALRLSIVHTTV